MKKNVFWPVIERMPWFFFTFFLITIDPAHHIYNIQLAENAFQWNLFISKFSSAAPSITDEFIERVCFPVYVHSLMTLLFYYNSSNTLMKLATGSKLRITSFENAAQRQLQTSSLSSKLNVRDDIVNECRYICNQNFDRRVHFHYVAMKIEFFGISMIKNVITLTCLTSKFQNFMMCIMFE